MSGKEKTQYSTYQEKQAADKKALFEACEQEDRNVNELKRRFRGLGKGLVNARNDSDETLFSVVCRKQDLELAEALVKNRYFVINPKPDETEMAPLQTASLRGYLSLVQVLVEKYQANVNLCNTHGTSSLFHACRGGHLDVSPSNLRA